MSNSGTATQGVVIASLGSRILAAVLDGIPPALAYAVWYVILNRAVQPVTVLVTSVVAGVAVLAWALVVWWGYATRGQSPGARIARISVLSAADGRALGWGRVFLRELVWAATMIIPILWIVLVVLMVTHPRRQGWHDLAAKSVVVKARTATIAATPSVQRASVAAANTVGLPGHLNRSGFSGAGEAVMAPPPPAPGPSSFGGGPITSLPFSPQSAPPRPDPGFQPVPGSVSPASQPWGSSQPVSGPVSPASQPWGASQPAPGALSPASQPWGSSQPVYEPVSPASQPWGPSQPAASSYPAFNPAPAAPVSQPPGPSQPPYPSPARAQSEDELNRTHYASPEQLAGLTPRPTTEGWQIKLDDGRSFDLTGMTLIGRDPQPRTGEAADLISVHDSRMVSKTHLAVGLDHRGVYVMDRGSTNGTAIANTGGQFEPCAPMDPVRVREGQIVSFGDRYLEIKRS